MVKAKRIAALILSCIMFCCLFAVFASCSEDEKIKDLQRQIEELKTKQDFQQNTIDRQQDTIDKLKGENEGLADRVDKLEQQVYGGKFYSLKESYREGFLTTEDLQIIAKYHHGESVNEEILSEDVAAVIRKAWAIQKDTTEENVNIRKYYGTYNGCVVVVADRKDAAYPAVYAPYQLEIGGVSFTFQLYGPQVYVWKIYG